MTIFMGERANEQMQFELFVEEGRGTAQLQQTKLFGKFLGTVIHLMVYTLSAQSPSQAIRNSALGGVICVVFDYFSPHHGDAIGDRASSDVVQHSTPSWLGDLVHEGGTAHTN